MRERRIRGGERIRDRKVVNSEMMNERRRELMNEKERGSGEHEVVKEGGKRQSEMMNGCVNFE